MWGLGKLIGVNGARGRAREAGAGLTCVKFQRFLGFFFLAGAQRQGLLECVAHLVQAFFLEVVDALGAFGIEIDEVVLAHGWLDDQLRIA